MIAPPPLRVLHVRTVRGTGGGPDKTVLKSCQYLARHGHRAAAFYMVDRRHDTGRLGALARDLGVRLVTAPEDSPFCPASIRALDRELRRGRYTIAHTHEYKSNALVQLLRPMHAMTIVATAHGYNRTTFREGLYYAIERAAFRHVAAVVAPNRTMRALLCRLGVPPARVHVIHNGLEIAGQSPPRPGAGAGAVRLLYLGRLSQEKDPANAVRALAELTRRDVQAELTLAGDGPESGAVRQLADELGLGGRVHMPGFVTDVMGLLANADILISPSRTECMPNSVLEAMWARVPVAATDVGGVGEMVRHESEALLCPPRDPVALARAVERLARDKALAARLADLAHQRLRNEFTFERRMERIVDLYRRLRPGRP